MNEDNPAQIDFWIKHFWNYFEREIRSGHPVYLCLDSQGIKNLAQPYLTHIKDVNAVDYFHTACNSMFNIYRDSAKAVITNEARNAICGQFSSAICLAIQQVLVVADMIDDQLMSYDSYFPRYRERLGLGHSQHSNPLSKDDFENIWNQLKREMLSIEGASEKTITFRAGTGRKNVTRNYPLSQALLSTRDLYSLRNYFILQNNIDTDASMRDIKRFFFNYRTYLTPRGRRAIQNDVLIRKVVDQFRTFLKTYTSEHERNNKADNSVTDATTNLFGTGTFIIGSKIQGFRERYTIRYKIDFDRQHHDRDCVPFLEQYIQSHNAYVFCESTNGYTSTEEECELRENDQFILCYRKDSEFATDSLLSGYFNKEWKQAFKPIELLNDSNFTFNKCIGIPADWPPISVSKGKIVAEKRERAICLNLRGGLQINKLKGLFLDGYPPSQIFFGDKPLSPPEVIIANGIETTVGNFLESINKKWGYKSFRIDYSGCVKEFAISDGSEDSDFNYIGFPKHGNVLYPIAQPLTRMSQGLCGWMSINDTIPSTSSVSLSMAEITWLARLEDKAWIRVNKDILDRVVDVVDATNLHVDLQNSIKARLVRTKKLPAALVSRHFSKEIV